MSKMKKFATLKDAKVGDITGPSEPQVMARCPHCRKTNPTLSSYPAGESSDAVQIMFVLECCKLVVGAQVIAKKTDLGDKVSEHDAKPN